MRLVVFWVVFVVLQPAARGAVVDLQFTAPSYNLSLFENSIGGGSVAGVDYAFTGPTAQLYSEANKIGVYLPKGYHQVNFRIVEGDKQQRFEASAKKLGNFAFLVIEHKNEEDILNRELQNQFTLLVRATAKRKKANALEASTIVNLRIVDENDNSPMFKKLEYSLQIDDRTALNSRLLQLDGFDADEGLNGELYFSLISPSNQFYVEAQTGWIRSYAPLKPGNYSLDCLIEDRASRLFYHKQQGDQDSDSSAQPVMFIRNKATVNVVVEPARHQHNRPKVHLQTLKFEPYQAHLQDAAILTIEDSVVDDLSSLQISTVNNSCCSNAVVQLRRQSPSQVVVKVSHYTNDLPIELRVHVVEALHMVRPILQLNYTLKPDLGERKVWLEGLLNKVVPVNESLPVGYVLAQFTAATTYLQDRIKIRYKLVVHNKSSNYIVPFDLNYHTGQLRLKSQLDYDDPQQQHVFDCSVIAGLFHNSQTHLNSKTLATPKVEHRVSLQLQDANDNCPEFLQVPSNYLVSVESKQPKTPADAVIYKPVVRDVDRGVNGQLVFKLLGVEGSENFFQINSSTGWVRISGGSLPPSSSQFWTIKVLAMDLGWPLSHHTQLTLHINVINNTINATASSVPKNGGLINTCDAPNMHPPTFSKDFPEMLEVREDDPPGTEIGQITTNDEDLGYNGLVQYSLTTNSYFNIHLYSGHLSIRRPLTELLQQKADKSSEFWEQSLEVVVRDMALNSSLSKAAKKMVNIRIYGANMHTPAFEQPAYFLKISENNVAGQELLILRATDQDIGPKNGKVEYRLAMEASELVSVDPDTGILRLEKSVDREQHPEYTLLVMAVDRGSPAKIAFANVTIEVEDVNDNAPFCSSIHKATLLEDSPNGLLIACIYAQDADLHQNAFLNYSINQQTSNKVPFRIDSATGCIFLHTDKPLDYQQTRFYNFSVQVFDQGSPPLNCSCPVEISLIDVNENILPPQFNEIALEASVEENLPPKTEVLKVQAVDPEGSVVTYKLVSGNGLGFFEIHPQTGVIRTSVVLDYEACVMYWLAVRAEDDSGPFALTSHLHVLVRVLNQNDRAPTFSQPIYFTSVSENSAENKVILKIEAVDPDMSSNKNVERGSGTGVKYAIVKGNPQSNFAVDENTGYLITGKRRLDRETQSEHELHIRACDQGTPQLCTTALVVVSIMDVNDNAPIFVNPSTTTITVPADHVGLLTQVFAYDLDADAPNSNIIYEIVGNTLFSIDQFGRLSCLEGLKAGHEVVLTLKGKDGGSPSLHSNTSLTLIPISRANKLTVANRKPELREQEVWKELYVSDSDSVGTVVGIVKAMDGDSDPLWWWTTPSITSNHTFAFKTNSGELVLAKPVSSIDFSLNEIELHFMVTDGLDEISDKIKIRISRSTTSRPKFLHPNSSVELSGISPLGFVPYTAHAVFDETRTGISHPHKIIYSIHSVDDIAAVEVFRMDASTGDLILEKVLPHGSFQNFTMVVSAKVGGKENFAMVHFHPKLSNKHAPTFVFDQYQFYLDNDWKTENPVGWVQAFDPDVKDYGRVGYSIVSGNENGLFTINSTTGELRLGNKDLPSNFTGALLAIRAHDFAPLHRSTTCTVRIYSVKEGAKSISNQQIQLTRKSLLFSIFDSTTIFTSLGPLDEIADSSGFLEFSFQQPCPFLDVHFSTGQIRLGKYLNELNATLLVNCSVVIKSAVDSNSVIVNLLLKITPKAWQQIHFLQLKYNGSIAENSPIGSLVSGNINGSIHQNHQLQLCIHQPKLSSINERTLKYRILSPIEPFFAIDSSTGRIRSVAPMDFELNKHWSFYVVAQSVTADSSAALVYTLQPSLVTISVLDTNDLPPVFEKMSVKLQLRLPTAQGTFLGGIIAKDEDTVGDLRYAIRQVKPASAQSLFSVDRINGEVFASSNDSSLFKSPNYKVNLIATDGLHTAHSALQIDLISPNHTKDIANTLQFPKDIYSISVPENLTFALNTELLSLWPSNADVNERFVFHLLNRHPSFIVDEQSGLLRLNLKYPLDREVTPKVQLMIKARSTLGNRRAYTSVHVEVEDINDCAPTFHQLPYTATISEEATVGDRVLSLKAKDNDLGMSGVVRYSLAADAPTFFQVNKYDGRVTIAALPPAKQLQLGSIFHFHVLATDKGNPALSSSTWVEVKVANKHQPSFSHSHYFAKISEAVSPGTYVISVRAYSNTDGVVGYRISEGDDLRHFAMDYNKGTITVNSQLDREQLDKYILKVEAVDVTRTGGGVHAAAAVAMVNIQVEDINDTPPQFQQPIYHFSVLESASLGSLLGEVKAEDPDHSSLANEVEDAGKAYQYLTYSIVEGNKSVLSLDASSGQLYLASPLDFENQRFYEYTIQVRDIDRLASEAILQLQILDVNDEAPLFSGIPQSPLQLNMMADSKNGDFIYKFHVEDRDTVATLANKAHKIEFQIAEGDQTLFDLDASFGVLTKARQLDDQELKQLENGRRLVKPLNVSATDGLFTIFIDVEVEIVPNAIAPLQFEQAFYSATINENRASTNKSSITIVKAKGGSFPMRYSIAGATENDTFWPFAVEPHSGRVLLSERVDREKMANEEGLFTIWLQATDSTNKSAFARLEVAVLDENDNQPVWIAPIDGYSMHLDMATAQEGEPIAMVLAVDADIDDRLEYSLLSDDKTNEPSKWLDIHPTQGYITLKKRSAATSASFLLRVSDSGNPPHQTQLPFHIHLVPSDASPPPQFSQLHYLFAVSEDAAIGKVVGHLHANELTQNSRDVIYTIASSNLDNLPFSLHKSSGQLTVSGALDYEQKSRFHFVAQIAETEQRLHSFAVVTVSVVDVSDNPPVFLTIYPHGLSIREDTPAGTTVAVFLAKADKHSSQSRTVYSMQQLQPPTTDPVFTLDGEYGWLMVGAGGLDSELHSNYTIAITASDEAGLKTTEQLIIQLVDLNDSPPMFGLSEYVVEINLEAVRLNSSILALDITDPDKNPSPPQTLQLFIVHGDAGGTFSIANQTQLIFKQLAEKGGVHLLTVVASDGLHSSQAKVKVIIKSPTAGQQLEAKEDVCQKEESIIIPANLPTGHVFHVLKKGVDKQGNRLNHLMDAAKLPFEIHNNTLLTLGEGFHHQMNYTLRIRSRIESDQGKWQSSCLQTLHIAIQNANRNAPTFEKKNFTTTIKENLNVSATHGYFVLKLDAEDEDLGEFGRLTYTISSKEAANKIFEHFSLDEVSGVLTLKKSLDREQQQVYEIPVKVADGGGLSDTAIITIRVEDVNNNAPIFRQPVYRLKVLENEQIGYVLLKVQAEDTDADTQVTYELAEDVPDSISQLVHLAADGTLKLAQTLDFEKLKKVVFNVVAKDSGQPPLSSQCTVDIEVLDVNDNSPLFQKTLYEASVKENSPVGTQIIQVVAIDSDSEHFGKVSYTLSQDSNGHSEYFSITDDGRLLLTKAVDYELIKVLHVNVAASDGGSPPLVDETLVKINVEDENDNPPVFGVCNLTAVVQEGVLPGQSLLTVSLTDSDSSPNGPPFRLELSGEGATSFAFDPLLNLITTQQIAYRQQNEYSLKVIAFDAGGMSSSCPLKVFVKQQSRYPPEVTPLLVTLNTLMGEFLGGPIGKVWAVDKDEADMLRYGIVDSNGAVSNPTSKFSIDAATGELSALPDLLPGLHRFNVSVTDGKYIVYGAVNVDVSNIDEDALDHSVSVRLKQLGVHRFVQHHMTRFHELLAKAVGVPTTSVRILSIQNIETGKEAKKLKQHILKDSKNRRLRHSSATNSSNEAHSDLDVLFTVLRGESRGYHRPTFVKQRIESSINEISEETGLEILSLTSEVCRRDSCVQKGECRDRLWLDNVHMEVVNTPSATLVCPRHVRTFECICRQGYSGRYCDVPVNQCSKELCMKTEMCIPSEELESGFVCVCPPGFGGERCAVPTCDEPSTCSQKQELSVLGNGFFQLFISNSMESRLELGVHFKTVSHNGVLMHGHGLIDFHTLQIREGCVEYRWNCGSGEAIVRLAHVRVDDGLWHHLKVSRRGRQTRIVVDESHKAEASSPPGSDVLNLFRQASLLTFGAKVSSPYEDNRLSLTNNSSIPTLEWLYSPSRQHQQHREMASELELRVEQGIIGCFGRISVDGFDLSKTEQGLRLHNVAIGCDTSSMGPCLNVPCKNGGQCLPNKTIENTYTCKCGTRYTGPNCQIDVNACASQPCPNGIACHNLYNDFHCSCPSGFTGKTCQMRGEWDVCLTSPCGPYGICVRNTDSSSSFTCNCSQGFHGNYCSERMPNIEPDTGLLTLHSFEFYLLVAVVLLAVLLSSLAIYVCRAQHKGGRRTKVGGGSKVGGREQEVCNPLVPRLTQAPGQGTADRPPPPLPPKFSKNSQMYQNLNSTARLPTVEVRPMQSHRIIQRNGCNSPSIKSFQSNEACVESKKGSSNASVHRVSKRNNCRKQSETASNQNLNNQSNRQYGSAAEDLQKLNGGSNDEMLRLFGRRLPENGQHSRHTSREHFFNDSPPTCSSSSHPLGDSIQCLPTTTQETADYNSQIENACVAAALSIRQEKQRIDHMTRNVLADFGAENNSDYLTMKPIHRAKPFRREWLFCPSPPMHRRQQQQERPLSTKVYDNPNEDDDTLSNITSQALDDNVT